MLYTAQTAALSDFLRIRISHKFRMPHHSLSDFKPWQSYRGSRMNFSFSYPPPSARLRTGPLWPILAVGRRGNKPPSIPFNARHQHGKAAIYGVLYRLIGTLEFTISHDRSLINKYRLEYEDAC